MDETNSERAGQNTKIIAEDLNDLSTSWNELKASGKTIIEASSTTHAKNSRFGLYENGVWTTPDRFDELVTRRPPLYEVTVPNGEVYTITGKERNPYSPGSDFLSGFASRFLDTGLEGDFLPSGLELTQGLVDLESGGNDEGIAVKFTENDVIFGTYQDGNFSNQKSISNDEWKEDPFNSEKYNFNLGRFSVKRIEGNLYGAGSQNLYFKLRDTNGEEDYIKVAETGDAINPIVDTFNLYNQLRIDNNTGGDVTVQFGPLNYFNEVEDGVPSRKKFGIQRDISISSGLDDATGDVIAVFRVDPNNNEVPVDMKVAASATTNGRIEIREVHPDYVDFGTIDPTLDGNWDAPNGLRQRETTLQSLNMNVGDVSIQSDIEGARGEQQSVVEYDGTSGQGNTPAQPAERVAEESARLNENNYFVATARHEDTTTNVKKFIPITQEGW